MRIAYVNFANIPTKHAHGIHIMKMAEALNNIEETHLIVPFFSKHFVYPKDLFEYYDIERRVPIIRLYVPDISYFLPYVGNTPLATLLNYIHRILFAITSTYYVLIKKYSIIYTREIFVAFFASLFMPVVYETHLFPRKNYVFRLMERVINKKALFIVNITHKAKEIYCRFGYDTSKHYVFHDATEDIVRCTATKHKMPVVLYLGSITTMGMHKGVEDLVYIASYIKEAEFWIVGIKTRQEMEILRSKIKGISNIKLFYAVPKKETKKYLCSADILLISFPFTEHMSLYASPLKLFDYMASGKCIITSDLPTIREVISEKEALFFIPGSKEDLIDKIRYALSHHKECIQKGKSAQQKVKAYTWKRRAENIIALMKQHLLHTHH